MIRLFVIHRSAFGFDEGRCVSLLRNNNQNIFLRVQIFFLEQYIVVSSAKLTINVLTNEKFALKTLFFFLRNKDPKTFIGLWVICMLDNKREKNRWIKI